MTINDVRNLPEMEEILRNCEGFGRTWGRKGSYFHGSHITFITKNEVVIIYHSKKKDSKFFIANFLRKGCESGKCDLKDRLITILEKHEIIFEEK